MQSTVEEVGPCRKKITITVPAEEINDEFEKSYKELISNIQLPGFRPGRVPRGVLEKRFGQEVSNDVRQSIITSSYKDALDENSFSPLGEPEIDIEAIHVDPKVDLTYDVTIEVKPEVDVSNYKGLKVNRPSSDITGEELTEAMSQLAKSRATTESAEGVSEADHVLVADIALKQNDTLIEEREGVNITPSQGHILGVPCPSLPDALVGVGPDSTHDLELDLTQGQNEENDEQEGEEKEEIPTTVATVTIKQVLKLIVPEINDEWAKEQDFDDVAELTEHVRKQLESRKKSQIDRALENGLVEELLKITPFEIPQGVVENELERAAGRYRIRLQVEGLEDENELDSKVAEYRSKAKSEVMKDFQKAFLLDKIATIEKIYVTEDEIEGQLQSIANSNGKRPEEVREYYEARNLMPELRAQIREVKAKQLLRENAEIVEEAAEKNE